VLTAVNLSLSSACGADCVFCPSDRGARISKKNMSLEVASKIIDEVTSLEFIAKYRTHTMHVGENGDCFINKDIVEILRYLKARNPVRGPDWQQFLYVSVFTDLQNFTPAIMETVCKEGLISFVGLNVDGASEETFSATKRLSSRYVKEYLPEFIRLREKYSAKIELGVLSLTMRHYVDAVRKHLNRDPIRVRDPEQLKMADDFEQIKAQILPMLRTGDTLERMKPQFWAERAGVAAATVDYTKYYCPLIDRVENEAFIAPDGTWYACCFDSNNQLGLGNVYEKSIDEVAQGGPRKRLIKLLKKQKFGDIGGPCATVNCCQYGINEPEKLSDDSTV